jgi:hypothetical protein
MQTTPIRVPRRLIVGAAAAVGAGALAVTLSTGSAGAGTSPSGTLRLVATGTGGGSVDNAPRGTSLGDGFFESGTVADGSGKTVGKFTVTGQLVGGTVHNGAVQNGLEQSETVVYLPGGTLVLDGGYPSQDGFSLPVVGGTGKYVGASGVGTFSPGAHDTQRVTIALRG